MYQKLRPHLNQRTLVKIIAIAFIVYGAVSTLRVIGRNYQLQQDLDKLQSEIELLKLQNQELEFNVAYYKTGAFVEKEARDKLGLQAPGEKVMIFTDRIPRGVDTGVDDPKKRSVQEAALSNLEQWLYFLFKKEPNN